MNTISTTASTFNYHNIHYESKAKAIFVFTQISATVFTPIVTAITNNLSKWKCKNNKVTLPGLEKHSTFPFICSISGGQTSNLQAHDSADEN